MGVSVRGYSNCKVSSAFIVDADGEAVDAKTGEIADYDSVLRFYIHPAFPGRADDIDCDAVYECEGSVLGFSASYFAYNEWRNILAMLAGYPRARVGEEDREHAYCIACWNGATGPFSELINFSDCEGTIGTSVATKLAKDFADYQEKVDHFHDPVFVRRYNSMREAFEAATHNGAVRFT